MLVSSFVYAPVMQVAMQAIFMTHSLWNQLLSAASFHLRL
jgi:hypothetical protein